MFDECYKETFSTIEVEYMAVTKGVNEVLWLWGFLDDLGLE